MVNQSSRTALVTGCWWGIGRETALQLHQAGLVVYATARRPGTLAGLAENGIQVLALDVTEEASMVAAVGAIAASRGQVDVLVNCAGFELAGTVEETPAGGGAHLFNTQCFGLARVAQLGVPRVAAPRACRSRQPHPGFS